MSTKKRPGKAKKRTPETALYAPIRDYLRSQGLEVRGEVKGCDIVAQKGEDVIVVELKAAIELSLLVQAVERQRLTDSVYIAVPRPSDKLWRKKGLGLKRLLRRLELGLIFVSRRIEVVLHPQPYQRRKHHAKRRALLQEFNARTGDYNLGGSTRKKLVTAYRENAIQIAMLLSRLGPQSPKQLRTLGTTPKTQAILYDNVYGWFDRVGRGQYGLNTKGLKELNDYPDLVALLSLPSSRED